MSNLLQSLASMPQPQVLQQVQPQETPPQTRPPAPQVTAALPGLPLSETKDRSKPAISQESLFKNRLQEYAQKNGIILPVYQTVNVGSYPPVFKSTVVINGATYTSPNVFRQRKAAEMDVAKIALLSLAQQNKEENCSLDQVDNMLCKSILNEYAHKIHVGNPIYNTIKTDDLPPFFVSSLSFNGKNYVGDEGRNKKESQQLAARAVILSVLDSDARTVISEIIKSKKTLSAAKDKAKNPCNSQNEVMTVGTQTESSVGTSASNGNELRVVVSNDNMPRTAIPEPCTVISSSVSAQPVPLHELGISKQEASLVEVNATPIIIVPPNLIKLFAGSTSVNKRKRETEEAENILGIDAQYSNNHN